MPLKMAEALGREVISLLVGPWSFGVLMVEARATQVRPVVV